MAVYTVNPGDTLAPALSRRDRQREATSLEIRDTARRQLAATGAAGLSLRAVAREMGLTAPALYRYFDDRDALLTALIVDAYTSLVEALEAARDAQPADRGAERLAAACLAYRQWGLDAPHDFALVFGSPVPGYEAPEDGPTREAGARFGQLCLELFAAAGGGQADDPPPSALRGQALDRALALAAEACGVALEPGPMQLFLSSWGRLHGLISLEVFGHLHWVGMPDPAALFRAEVADLLRRIGVELTREQLVRVERRSARA